MITSPFRILRPFILVVSLLVTVVAFGAETSPEKPSEKSAGKPIAKTKGKPGSANERFRDKGEAARLEAWQSLSPEQREKLKEALRNVWTDPAVMSAREEVKQAGDAYQESIRAAVSRVDPAMGEVMSKIQRSNSGMAHDHIWGSPALGKGEPPKGNSQGQGQGQGPQGGGARGKRAFDYQIKPPGFLETLPEAEREKFRQAEEMSLDAASVKAARLALDQIRDEDEALRRKRFEAHRTLRKVTLDEMIRIDPSLAEIRKKLSGEDRSGPKAAPRKEKAQPDKPGGEAQGSDAAGAPADRKPEP